MKASKTTVFFTIGHFANKQDCWRKSKESNDGIGKQTRHPAGVRFCKKVLAHDSCSFFPRRLEPILKITVYGLDVSSSCKNNLC